MASITRDKKGNRRIQFVSLDGKKRPAIRLGKVSHRAAEAVKVRVEQLLECLMFKRPMDAELGKWVAALDFRLAKKLAAVELIADPQEKEVVTLGAFITSYIDGRTDVKPATKEVWRQGEKGLVDYFGANKPLLEITPGDADGYKLKLIGEKLAPMTIKKRLQFATMISRAAMRRRLIAESPFAGVSIKAGMPDRSRFITRAETTKLLDACPNNDWRLIVALARYGGLRCPSEVLSLRWQDVDWTAEEIEVQSPKTEHHPGKATRTIPLFPELREYLEAAFDPQATYVVDESMRASARGKAGWRNCNLRTPFERIVKRAGLTKWPRLFHNLRSSRQTELAEEFPSHVVCEWLGNSEDIARKHYYQVTEDHFAKATRKPSVNTAKAENIGSAESGALVAQNQAQHSQAEVSGESHESPQLPAPVSTSAIPSESEPDAATTRSGWGGIRLPAENTGKIAPSPESGAESGALAAQSGHFDPDLGRVIDAWPTLPEYLRRCILTLLSESKPTEQGDSP